MRVSYSQLLFIISICGVGVSLFMYAYGHIERTRKQRASAESLILTGGRYQPILAEEPIAATGHWGPPAPQDAEGKWLFGVFTPPRIGFNGDTCEWTVYPPKAESLGVPFTLKRVERIPYRLRFKGYSGDSAAPKLLIEDVVTEQAFLGFVGAELAEIGVMVLSFNEGLPHRKDGSKARTAAITIRDLHTGEEYSLLQGALCSTDVLLVTLQAVDEGSRRFTLNAVGDTFSHKGKEYRLSAIDVSERIVTLEARPPEASEMVTTYVVRQKP